MPIHVDNRIIAGRGENVYLIARNSCNAFVIGEVGSSDDFFLVGAEPEQESPYPLLTGNFFDSEAQHLFTLARNVLTINPGRCSKIVGDHIGYEIHDSAGQMVFKVRTSFRALPEEAEERWVTTLHGNFYDRHGRCVFSARDSEEGELIEANTKYGLGFNGASLMMLAGMSEMEHRLACLVLATGGKAYQPLRGLIEDEDVLLDGKVLIDAHLRGCRIRVVTGDYAALGSLMFTNCRFGFDGPAMNVFVIAANTCTASSCPNKAFLAGLAR